QALRAQRLVERREVLRPRTCRGGRQRRCRQTLTAPLGPQLAPENLLQREARRIVIVQREMKDQLGPEPFQAGGELRMSLGESALATAIGQQRQQPQQVALAGAEDTIKEESAALALL